MTLLDTEAQQVASARNGRAAAMRASLLGTAKTTEGNAQLVSTDPDGEDYNDLHVGQKGAEEKNETLKDKIENVRRSTLLNPEYVKQLEMQNPQAVSFLQSYAGLLFQVGLFCLFVVMDAGKSIFNGLALKRTDKHPYYAMAPSVQGFTQSLSSIIIGMTVCAFAGGVAGVKEALNPFQIARFGIPAMLFSISITFNALSYTILDPGTIKIVGQCRLLQTAILSRFVLGRKYLPTQWCIMLIIVSLAASFQMANTANKDFHKIMSPEKGTFTVCSRYVEQEVQNYVPSPYANGKFGCDINKNQTSCAADSTCLWATYPKEGCTQNKKMVNIKEIGDKCAPKKKDDEGKQQILGLVYVFLYLFLSDVGSLYSEKFMKDGSTTPFYAQKVMIEFVGLPVATTMSFVSPYIQYYMQGDAKDKWLKKNLHQFYWTDWKPLLKKPDPKKPKNKAKWAKGHEHTSAGDLKALGFGAAFNQFYANTFKDDKFDNVRWAFMGMLVFVIGQSWISGLLVKKLSSVMKLLGKCCSLAVTYLAGDCLIIRMGKPDQPPISPVCLASSAGVVVATYTFTQVKPGKEDKPKEKPPDAVAGTEMTNRSPNP